MCDGDDLLQMHHNLAPATRTIQNAPWQDLSPPTLQLRSGGIGGCLLGPVRMTMRAYKPQLTWHRMPASWLAAVQLRSS